MQFEFTKKEVDVLKEFINVGLKTCGISAAEYALILHNKLSNPRPDHFKVEDDDE